MSWIYRAYRWPSEAAYLAALAAAGWASVSPPEVTLLAVGTVHAPPVDEATPAEALPGWHVSAAFRGVPAPPGWDALEIDPPAEMPVLGRTPPPTLADYQAAVEAHVEGTARARDYASAVSCASYVYSTNPAWAAEATAFVAWRDAVWIEVYGTLAAVQGVAPAPTIAALVAGLPAMEWPA
jgi:hypothetical protein